MTAPEFNGDVLMATERQIQANRRNAARSTGPRTAEGKRASRLNAVKHGLLSDGAFVPTLERREDWEEFREGLRASLQPMGALESLLAEQVIAAAWRLARVVRIDGDMMDVEQRWSNLASGGPPLPSDGRPLDGAEDGAPRLSTGPVRLPAVEKFSHVVRYEAHLHRQFMQCLHELQRVQDRRLGTTEAAPAAVDVVLSHDVIERSPQA
jgi:hypothetical protein